MQVHILCTVRLLLDAVEWLLEQNFTYVWSKKCYLCDGCLKMVFRGSFYYICLEGTI